MKEVLLPLKKIEWRSLPGTLISLLLVITGLLGVIAIQGHALTAGKNVEKQLLALLTLDSVEETLLAMGDKGLSFCEGSGLERFNGMVAVVGSQARLTLRSDCPVLAGEGTNVFVFQVKWQEFGSFEEAYNLAPDTVALSREVFM